ncbi:Sodium/calcium exchanger protein-domain-containing protein [Mucor lusitanicus]|uniref:Sodium/calcium exchanger protein-domain-containing protein n=1 Tax=Mucor circinelloides f. lusitanicus TaxID=29924 RepID=A0A8H4BUC6_MUCCL|nr:Sodium/calcium exchanger protein-domain-containing protein [Mucor lusitanicus]
MKSTTFWLMVLVLCPLMASASLLVPISSTLSHHHKSCSDIETHKDQCAFVMSACHGFSGVFLKFYYCSTLWQPITIVIMLSGLLLLFGAVSVVAADFFCPNLQTISSRLQLSESMAGVTVLAFGNGSPDLFSTFTAMNSGSGSLAIGELIGAAFFIVSVVSGCMGIIRPFRSKRITFMRDASFLTGAIMILTWIVYHQRICWYHGLILICYYITYVIVVVMGAYRFPGAETPALPEPKSVIMEHCNTEELLTETSRLLQSTPDGPLRLDIPIHGFQSQEHLGHVIRPVSPNSSHLSRRSSLHIDSYFPRTTSTNGSISSRLYRHAMSPRVGIRTSLFSAIEFQEQVASIKRANSTQLYPHKRDTSSVLRQRHTQASVPCISAARQRQESADHLLTTAHLMPNSSTRTPESSYTNNNNDYFTYISASQQNHRLASPNPNESSNEDRPIPEIRLAPPNLEEQQQQPLDNVSIHVPFKNQDELKISVSMSMVVDDVCCTLFPTLQDWSSKTAFAKLSALVAVPLVLIFTLTLPVAEGDEVKVDDIEVLAPATTTTNEPQTNQQIVVITSSSAGEGETPTRATAPAASKSYLTVPTSERSISELNTDEDLPLLIEEDEGQLGWCRWLVAVQAVCATTFVTSVMALNGFVPAFGILVGFFIGCVLSCLVLYKTKANEAPTWHWMLSFVGFVIALNWIFLLANEMVGLLQALGAIFDISEAIMGLTIFALGNSVGDLVANTAIAKMGFPTMAISACYAGPLLNMVLGVGISSTYQTWVTGKPYELDIAPTILISSAGLITVLLSTLIVVNINGYHINSGLGWWMIIVYLTCTVVNVLIEFHVVH